MIKALYSLTDVSKLLGRPKSTVAKWIKKGVLETIEIGGLRYVPLAALKFHGLLWESVLLAGDLNARRTGKSGNARVPG